MGCMTSAPAVPRSAPVTAATGSGFRRHDRGTVDAFSGAVEAPRPLFDPVAGVDDMPPLDPSHLGLAHLFQQTALLRMFMAFAASRCAEENVLFLRDVKEWERSLRGDKGADGKGARASAKFMVDEYIRPDAPMEVNISDRTRKAVLSAYASGEVLASTFTPAETEVSKGLQDNFWAEFVKLVADQAAAPVPRSPSPSRRKRVVIIGGGFCGTYCAIMLDADPRVEVVLVDTKDYFEYTPSIIKAFSRPETHAAIVQPHAKTVRNGRVIVGEVRAVRSDCVAVNFETITFDYLVIASGSHYPSAVKSTNVTVAYRGKVVRQQRALIDAAKQICVIGGGVVGVEMAAELAGVHRKKITLVHSRDRLLPKLGPGADGRDGHDMAYEHLERAGVTVRLGERATHWDDSLKAVVTSSGPPIPADRVLWCGGPQPLTAFMRPHLPSTLDSHGFVKVSTALTVEGHPTMFAGGDIITIQCGPVAAELDRPAVIDPGQSAHSEHGAVARRPASSEAHVHGSTGGSIARLGAAVNTVADDGYVLEERMARNAVHHGLHIAKNIRNLVEGKPVVPRVVERGVHAMLVSLGTRDGILVTDGVPSFGPFISKKDWYEATVMQEVREHRVIVHT
ncbi:hypothetical protein FNF27_04769 [Cafeteria roenbergensis]|uniref:RGS domain-containing protein n=1 Tax=Cafeteria roenbergensis TaxID=33653 RepID=A0A5A8DJP9_CAFRO|nr:hypothetical protein FNF29_04652 [Cafeteria roenbergensis]KAA0157937.1 hypothetical protein FNF28_06444 [Cafeteria roenbergensis]KAA0165359.1 hypothetical protein FNF31_02021 [Cafeteria roenbergensis]KAA0173812.1 hypothetical protein FNF27_04769 [Cafeteria roenbergensis]|eukprot:KAA0151444.1 hypothetical protein FNF29_04652 [Cafeteria roenbergensis]